MYNSKIITIFRTFSATELRQLRDIVRSPFFNTNRRVMALFNFILQYADIRFASPALTKENAYLFIFGQATDTARQRVRLNKLMSKLLALVEVYVFWCQTTHQPLEHRLSMLAWFNTHHLHAYYEHEYAYLDHYLAAEQTDNPEQYFYQYRLAEEHSQYLSSKQDTGTDDVHFQPVNTALDTFYLTAKLELLCQMYNRQRSVNYRYDFTLADELLQYIAQSRYVEMPIIGVWYAALRLLKEPSVAHYNELKEQLTRHQTTISSEKSKVLYTYLHNTLREVLTEKSYLEELFDLYNLQIAKGLIFPLAPAQFRNIVYVALQLQKSKWAAEFMAAHQQDIAEHPDKTTVYALCRAFVAFEKQQFDKALEIINGIAFDNIYLKLEEKRLRLKIYVELGEPDLLGSALNAARKFLSVNRAAIATIHLAANRQFINFTEHVFDTLPNEKAKIETLLLKIKNTVNLPEKSWLLAKLAPR